MPRLQVESYKGYIDDYMKVQGQMYEKVKNQFNLIFGGMPHVTLSKKEVK